MKIKNDLRELGFLYIASNQTKLDQLRTYIAIHTEEAIAIHQNDLLA